jgi:hypothetical protein
LRPQSDQRCSIRRQCEGFIVSICVQALRAAEYSRQRLNRDAHNIVQRLLDRQRDARGLRMETHLQSAFV